MTTILDDGPELLGFDGAPFDPLPGPANQSPAMHTAASQPEASQAAGASPEQAPAAEPPRPAGATTGDPALALAARLRAGLLAAHVSAMRVQDGWQELALAAARRAAAGGSPAQPGTAVPAPAAVRADEPAAAASKTAVAANKPAVAADKPAGAADEPAVPADEVIQVPFDGSTDPAGVDGWLSVAGVLRAAWAALRGAGWPAGGGARPDWQVRRATVVALGELPRSGERLAIQAVTAGVGPGEAGVTALVRSLDSGRTVCEIVAGEIIDVTVAVAGWTGGEPPAPAAAPAEPPWEEAAFKPLARTDRRALGPADLDALARGEIAGVFGPAYDQQGCNPSVRLAPVAGRRLTAVTELDRRGGPLRRGRLRGACRLAADGPVDGPEPVAAAALDAGWQAASVLAMSLGLHLCLADARFDVALPDESVDPVPGADRLTVEVFAAAPAGEVELVCDVTYVDLVPRPWLRADVEVRDARGPVAVVRGLTLAVREKPGVPVGPAAGGVVTAFLGRRNAAGEPALLHELHMAHGARGDLAVSLGPEFAPSRGRRACRLPGGGLRLVDRFMSVDGRRGELSGGAVAITEYDSPADSWYYGDYASPTMPNVIHMETSLQSALMLGYYLGATLTDPPDEYCLRNLDGTATVLREVDLRGRTIRQTSRLLGTTRLKGAVLQNFAYELSVDGEPFYAGESLFGFFNAHALANQNGLDGGEVVPTWLETQAPAPAARTIDVSARRAAGEPLCSRGPLALLTEVEVVDGGGRHGQGYLRAGRVIDASDWYFTRHFRLDPVMPGSLGIEAVIQAIQEWMVDAGLTDGFADPWFVMPVGLPMTWRYRGQILATDAVMTLEVHIKEVRRGPDRVRVVADASVWKPGMRIYGLTDIAAEAHDRAAEAHDRAAEAHDREARS